MNASEMIDDLITKLTDWHAFTLANLRKIIHDADPEIVEEWKRYCMCCEVTTRS